MNDTSLTSRPWIAIASYDPRFFRICENYLACLGNHIIQYETYQSGEELLAQLKKGFPYQALLLDNSLADMDTLTFCRRLQELDPSCRPWLLLVLTYDAQMLDSLFQKESGVRSWAPRLSSLNSLLLDLQTLLLSSPQPGTGSFSQLLASWGAPPHMIGVDYLKEAVILALQYDNHFAIRKDILREVADRHIITDHAVDSGIRRLIRALDHRNTPAWRSFRQRHNLPYDAQLTTGTLIYAIWNELAASPPGTKSLPDTNATPEGEPRPNERETQPASAEL